MTNATVSDFPLPRSALRVGVVDNKVEDDVGNAVKRRRGSIEMGEVVRRTIETPQI